MSKFRMTRRERDALRAKRRKQARIEQAAEEGDPPKDIDVFRYAMARRIAMFVGERRQAWRRCPEHLCKRHRACLAPHNRCSALPVAPPRTPEQDARLRANLSRALRQAIEKRGVGK
jgi:hypothetical protein